MASKTTKRRRRDEAEGATPRQRRRRTAFTDDQLNLLEDVFQGEKYPGITLRTNLAHELGIGEDRVQVWYQNRRARWRKREIKNKPAPLQPGVMDGHVPPVPYQVFPHQTVFPPLRTPNETTVTWPLPAPYTTSSATYGFLPQPGPSSLPVTSSSQLQYFPLCSAVTHPLVFPYSLQAKGTAHSTLSPATTRSAPVVSQNCGAERLSSDEYIAAVTLMSAFNRQQ